MSREEAMNALIESGMELRRDDIELGKKLERERILRIIEHYRNKPTFGYSNLISLIKGGNDV